MFSSYTLKPLIFKSISTVVVVSDLSLVITKSLRGVYLNLNHIFGMSDTYL